MKAILTLLFPYAICATSPVFGQQANPDSLAKEIKEIKKDLGTLPHLKITGWVQTQFQYVKTRGAASYEGGNFSPNSDKRFMIRRGRIKFTYNGKNTQHVIQMNGSERGVNLVEMYSTITDPWVKAFSITAGVMNRPFGFEIDQSSSVRESPERSRYTQILMPNERDLGAKIVIAPGKKSKLYGLRVDAGMYNGQGIYVPGTSAPAGYANGTTPMLGVNEFDFGKDFIGRFSYYKSLKDEKYKFGLGVSHYNGGNIYSTNMVYRKLITDEVTGNKIWLPVDSTQTPLKNRVAPRVYYGAEAFFSMNTKLGTTTLRGEYITGTQPGTSSNSASPFFQPAAGATYVRKFNGMYAYFIQRIAKTKHEVVLKYEWYDPNTEVSGKEITGTGANALSAADIKYTQLGLGYNYYYDTNVKFMFYYNLISNESTGIAAYNKDLKDNVFTFRIQYKF